MLSYGSTELWWSHIRTVVRGGLPLARAALGIDSDHMLQVFPCLSGSSSP